MLRATGETPVVNLSAGMWIAAVLAGAFAFAFVLGFRPAAGFAEELFTEPAEFGWSAFNEAPAHAGEAPRGATTQPPPFAPPFGTDDGLNECAPLEWTCLPDGLLYRSYVAGEKESRFSTAWLYGTDGNWWWDSTLGGRVGIVRYDPHRRDEGVWQLDMEGAALVRLDMENSEDLHGVDFRFGVPLTWRNGPIAMKAGYYHISAHMGDEYLERNPGVERINYVRESLVLGVSRDLTEEWMAYAEIGCAFVASGGAKPLEFQFGLQYDAIAEDWKYAAPFAAVNVHLRQEVDFGGSINGMAGWRWTGSRNNRTWRTGLQVFHGKSAQYSFFRQTETLVGLGLWYDY